MRKLYIVVIVFGLPMVAADSARAINLLTNGDFELGAPGPDFPDWTFFERVPSQPTATINNLEQPTFGNPPADPGTPAPPRLAWLRPFAGNQGSFMGQDVLNEAGISQTVAAQAGETYTFKGWSRFEPNYSGGLDTVDGNPSLTTTTWNLDFLNSGGSVIGGASPFNVRTDREAQSILGIANDDQWREHTLMATAPIGTASVRVTAGGYNMVSNDTNTNTQSAMFDTFSLRGAAAPGTELLSNPNLNVGAFTPPPLQNWTVVASPATAGDQGGNFADNPNSPGVVGYWVRAFLGTTTNPADSALSQRVSASAGQVFNYSAWAAFGQNYSGGTGPAKPATITEMQIAFLDGSQTEISETSLDLWDAGLRNAPGNINQNPQAWQQFFINGQAAPAGTAFVEVRLVVTDAVTGPNPDPSAFFDDFVLELASATPGDFNSNGKVDAADYITWRKNGEPNTAGAGPLPNDGGAANQNARLALWRANFGNPPGTGSGLGGTAAVPEPAGCLILLSALFTVGIGRRARASR
jgi:hypothetical protein